MRFFLNQREKNRKIWDFWGKVSRPESGWRNPTQAANKLSDPTRAKKFLTRLFG